MTPLVVCTVGTDHHPFDRLVAWVDRWARSRPDVRVVVQHGTSAPPRFAEGVDLVPRDELDALLRDAIAVVSHGGPATLAQITDAGTMPVCVPRDPRLGEHVDAHQLRFAEHQSAHRRIRLARSEPQLRELLDKALAEPELLATSPNRIRVEQAVERFGDYVEALLTDPDGLDRLHADALDEAAHSDD